MRHLLVMLALLMMPVAILAPTPAAAQGDGTLVCGANTKFSERWRSSRYQGTTSGQEFRNSCSFAIKIYYCVSIDPDPESCALVSQFSHVVLQPGAVTRIYPTARNTTQYVHNIQCYEMEQLVDWKSQYTTVKGPRCKGPLPASINRAAYPGNGAPPNPSAPAATLRNGETLAEFVEYPPSLSGTLIEGRVTASVTVSPMGRGIGCRVTGSSGYYDLDKATCDVMMRHGRFSPGKDASGNSVESVAETKLLWSSP